MQNLAIQLAASHVAGDTGTSRLRPLQSNRFSCYAGTTDALLPCVWWLGELGGWNGIGPGFSSVWFGGEVELGHPQHEYSREIQGDPIPQNFTEVCPRWDERATEVRTRTRSRRGAVPDTEKRRERSHALERFLYRSRRASPVALPRTAVPRPGEL